MSNSNDSSSNNATTVQFDVGGTVYKVSRSLLELFPNTMLSRMVSETWQEVQVARDEEDPSEAAPIFVDRDGERFRYVLDYMRDGQKASLPITISKKGFLKDLEYYGFDDVDAESITVEGSSLAVYQKMKKRMRKLDQETVKRFQRDYEISRLAHYCFLRFQYTGELMFSIGSGHEEGTFADQEHLKYRYNDLDVQKELKAILNSIRIGKSCNNKKGACFIKCLRVYGLNCINLDYRCARVRVTLEIIDGM